MSEIFFHPFQASPKKKRKKEKAREVKTTKDGDAKSKRVPAVPTNFILRTKRKPAPEVGRIERESDSDSKIAEAESESESESSYEPPKPPPPPKKKKKKKKQSDAYRNIVPSKNTIAVHHNSKWFVSQMKKDRSVARDCLEALTVYLPEEFEKLKKLDRPGLLRLKYDVIEVYGDMDHIVDFEEDEDDSVSVETKRVDAIMNLSGKGDEVEKKSGQVFEQYLMNEEQVNFYVPYFAGLKQTQISKSLANSNQEWHDTILVKFLNFSFHYLMYSKDGVPFDTETLFERCTGYKLNGFVKKFRALIFFSVIAYDPARVLVKSYGKTPRRLIESKDGKEEINKRIRSVLAEPNREVQMPEKLFYKIFPDFRKRSGFWKKENKEDVKEDKEAMEVADEESEDENEEAEDEDPELLPASQKKKERKQKAQKVPKAKPKPKVNPKTKSKAKPKAKKRKAPTRRRKAAKKRKT
jgi:hypothetical protein